MSLPARLSLLLFVYNIVSSQTISVNPAGKFLITKAKSIGVNIEMNAVDDAMWNSNGKWMKEIFSAAGIKSMRWGYGAWNWDWQNEQPLCFDFMAQYNTHDANGSFGFMEFIDYCRESNTTPIVMLPVTVEQYPQHTWADVRTLIMSMVTYVHGQGLSNVYFELGNEPGFRLTESVYLSRLSDIYFGIKSINSSFKVVASITGFDEALIRPGAAYFDAVDHHNYEPLNYWNGYYSRDDDALSSPSPLIGGTEEVLGECNILWPDWNGSMARDVQTSLPLMNVFLNAITLNRASVITSWPSHWAGLSGLPSYGIFEYDLWEKYHRMKLYTGPLLAHQITNDAVLDYSVPASSSDPKIRVFCFSDAANSKINLVLINKNSFASTVSISLGTQIDYVNAFEFKGSSLSDTLPTLTNTNTNQSVNSTTYSYALPRESAVVLQLFNDNSTDRPQVFTAVSPGNGASDVSTYKNFVWQNTNDVNYYRVQVSDREDLSNTILDMVTGNTNHAQSLTPLNAITRYYWNVTAYNKNGSTSMSAVPLTFTTANPVGLPAYTAEIKNGNFEDYTGWTNWSDDVTLTTDASNVHVGNAALSLGVTSTGLNQYIRGFTPGGEYTFSLSSKFTDLNDSVYLVIQSRDSTEAVIQSQGALLVPHTSYHDTTLSFTMPANIFRNNISFYKASANKGRVYIDNLSLGGSLPVELMNFTAVVIHGEILLSWTTATEANNAGFEIQRRTASTPWQKIGYVEGQGTSNSPNKYGYHDIVRAKGTFVYRLKQIDRNGTFSYSEEREIPYAIPAVFALEQNYPNPFNPTTTIEFSVPVKGFATLKVYNVIGQEVTTLYNDIADMGEYHRAVFDGSQLSSGIYIARLQYNGTSLLKKLLLTK